MVEFSTVQTVLSLLLTAVFLVGGLVFIEIALPKNLKKEFESLIYLLPILFSIMLYVQLESFFTLFPQIIYLVLLTFSLALFMFIGAFAYGFASPIIKRNFKIKNSLSQLENGLKNLTSTKRPIHPLPNYTAHQYYPHQSTSDRISNKTPGIGFIAKDQSNRQSNLGRFQATPTLQRGDANSTTWTPTPTIIVTKGAPLTKDSISINIETPPRAKQGDTLIIRVDVSNTHPSISVRDKGLLDIRFPTGVNQMYGPDDIVLQEGGDTTSLYYTWTVPHLIGNYHLKYILLNFQAQSNKAIEVVK